MNLILEEHIVVNSLPTDCFNYLLDFSRVAEWDPGVHRAARLDQGSIREGSMFEVECALPVGSIALEYTLEKARAPEQLVLRGKGRFFEVLDTITIAAVEVDGECVGSKIRYRAEFSFSSVPSFVLKTLEPSMQTMGKRAVAGLKAALDGADAIAELDIVERLADKLVFPGMLQFTRLGFERSEKDFAVNSAQLLGKHVVITGTTSGIGRAVATQAARRGADLTLVMRDSERAKTLVKELKALSGNKNIRYKLADLSLMKSVDRLVAQLLKEGRPIDALVNNAGALLNEQRTTAEGYDESLALLLLSPYRLTQRLKPLLVLSNDPRVVNVVSGGMYTQKLNPDLLFEPSPNRYRGAIAYAQAKRGLMLLTQRWAEEWSGDGICVNAMHPGWADTPGVEASLPEFYRLTGSILRTPQQGGDTIDWLISAPEANLLSGELFLDRKPRATYLIPGTQESPLQRERLFQSLQAMALVDDRFEEATVEESPA